MRGEKPLREVRNPFPLAWRVLQWAVIGLLTTKKDMFGKESSRGRLRHSLHHGMEGTHTPRKGDGEQHRHFDPCKRHLHFNSIADVRRPITFAVALAGKILDIFGFFWGKKGPKYP